MLKKYFPCIALVPLVFFCCLILSCKKQDSTTTTRTYRTTDASSEKTITIGFSIDTLAIERWQRDMDVFINKAKEMGADVIVQNAGNNIEEQNRQLMYLLERNVNAVVVLPKDASSIISLFKSLNIETKKYEEYFTYGKI